jgi:hypothetical protein
MNGNSPSIMRQAWNAESSVPLHTPGEIVRMPAQFDGTNYVAERTLMYFQAGEALGAVGSALFASFVTDRIKYIDTLPAAEDSYGWVGINNIAMTNDYYGWMLLAGPTLGTIATSATVVAGDTLYPDATGTWAVVVPATAALVYPGSGGRIVTTLARTGAGTLTAGKVLLVPRG